MKWFKHDSNAHADAKLKRVKHRYGITGYGIYWYCVELVASKIDSKNITFALEEDAELISIEWNIDELLVQDILDYFVELKLFEGAGPVFTCFKLAKRLDDTNSKNPQIKSILSRLNPNISDNVGETPKDSGQTRLDKIRLDKTIKKKGGKPPTTKNKRFEPPSVQDVIDYKNERNSHIDPNRFVDYYMSTGWMINKNKMKDWKATFRGWESRESNHVNKSPNQPSDRPRSPADRLRATVAQQERDDSIVGEDVGDLRPQVGRVVRDDAVRGLDLQPQGHLTGDDENRAGEDGACQ